MVPPTVGRSSHIILLYLKIKLSKYITCILEKQFILPTIRKDNWCPKRKRWPVIVLLLPATYSPTNANFQRWKLGTVLCLDHFQFGLASHFKKDLEESCKCLINRFFVPVFPFWLTDQIYLSPSQYSLCCLTFLGNGKWRWASESPAISLSKQNFQCAHSVLQSVLVTDALT